MSIIESLSRNVSCLVTGDCTLLCGLRSQLNTHFTFYAKDKVELRVQVSLMIE